MTPEDKDAVVDLLREVVEETAALDDVAPGALTSRAGRERALAAGMLHAFSARILARMGLRRMEAGDWPAAAVLTARALAVLARGHRHADRGGIAEALPARGRPTTGERDRDLYLAARALRDADSTLTTGDACLAALGSNDDLRHAFGLLTLDSLRRAYRRGSKK